MDAAALFSEIQKKKSFLCVGLDTDIHKIPKHLKGEADPVFAFNRAIIDATIPYTVAYKPNMAFYEIGGAAGWDSLQRTIEYIKSKSPDIFIIADAKRGDIGNTSAMYAATFFENINVDAVTLSPYMGKDTVFPFLQYKDKWSVLLALTSNESAADYQYFEGVNGRRLYEEVLYSSRKWAGKDQLMYVVGATKAEELKKIRKIIPEYFLLIPGVGAQGGDLKSVVENGMNRQCGLLINSSRGIIYASSGEDFAERAAERSRELQVEMEKLLAIAGLI